MDIGNPHPIVVHFPVAFITVYCILELLRLRTFTSLPYWFYVKASILFIGFVGSLGALITGLYIVGGLPKDPVTVVHSMWGAQTALIFGYVSIVYFFEWTKKKNKKPPRVFHYRSRLLFLIAGIGLMSVTVTGALGGVIVRGPQTDPMAQFLYNLLISGK